jgi:hypothetical protein
VKQKDRELAEYIRSAYELGDPKWREMAIAHLKQMMADPDSANRIAAVLKVLSERTKH